MNQPIFESSLLIILLVALLRTEILRINFFAHYIVLILVVALVACFVFLSLLSYLRIQKLRIFIVFLIAFVIYSFSLSSNMAIRSQNRDSVHDGLVQIEHATGQFLAGKNPYTISYQEVFINRETKPQDVVFGNFVYSPVSFLINIPAYLVGSLFGVVDLRFTLFTLFFATAFLGSLLVTHRIIFLIVFLFNPLFVAFLIYGANEIMLLFFIILNIFFLARNRINFATVMLSLAVAVKLLALPLVPVYFMYLLVNRARGPVSRFLPASARSRSNSKVHLLKLGSLRAVGNPSSPATPRPESATVVKQQLGIFMIFTSVIHLPFAIWDTGEFFADLFLTHFAGGAQQYSIVGFIGVPQLLSQLGFISNYSTLPFYMFMILVGILSFIPIYWLIKKSPSITNLVIAYFLYSCAGLIFSRIVQTTFVAYLSQILLLASLVKNSRDK